VPKKLELSGKKETFTATLTYDTPNLFGKIKASWKFAITAQ
jgi:hypothetical protein